MRRIDTTSTAPLALVAAIEARHRGLRHLELQQLRGNRSYQTIPGHRFETRHGEDFCEHDERPDDTPEQIAAELFATATAHHAKVKGDERFRVVLYFVKKDGGVDTRDAKFSLRDGDDEHDDADAPAVIDALARRDMLEAIRDYVKQLHDHDKECQQSFRDQQRETTALIGTLSTGVRQIFDTLASTIPRLVDLRLEAIEDRAEAILEGSGARPKAAAADSQWKESIGSLKELFAGPIGQAGLAKLFGMSPAEAASVLGMGAPSPGTSSSGAANTAPSPDLRVHLRELGASLSAEQSAALRQRLGNTFATAMLEAGGATTIAAAVPAMVKGFDSLKPEQFAVFDEVLDERQQALLRLVFDALEQIADNAE